MVRFIIAAALLLAFVACGGGLSGEGRIEGTGDSIEKCDMAQGTYRFRIGNESTGRIRTTIYDELGRLHPIAPLADTSGPSVFQETVRFGGYYLTPGPCEIKIESDGDWWIEIEKLSETL